MCVLSPQDPASSHWSVCLRAVRSEAEVHFLPNDQLTPEDLLATNAATSLVLNRGN